MSFAASVFATAALATVGLTASTGTLPLSGVAGSAYSGSFSCRNTGTETVTNVNCSVAGLPAWANVGACSPAVPVASLPSAPPGLAGIFDTIRCAVSGTPTSAETFGVTITATGDGVSSVFTRTVRIYSTPTAQTVFANFPIAMVGQPYSGSYACWAEGTSADQLGVRYDRPACMGHKNLHSG